MFIKTVVCISLPPSGPPTWFSFTVLLVGTALCAIIYAVFLPYYDHQVIVFKARPLRADTPTLLCRGPAPYLCFRGTTQGLGGTRRGFQGTPPGAGGPTQGTAGISQGTGDTTQGTLGVPRRILGLPQRVPGVLLGGRLHRVGQSSPAHHPPNPTSPFIIP